MQPTVHRVRTAMRLALVLLAAFLALLAPAAADDEADRARIDALFAQLRVAPNEAAAKAIDQQIWFLWTTPSDLALAGRMTNVIVARQRSGPTAAIALLDRLVVDYPDYAEAWNQRATMHYLLGDYDASLADCDRVIALEPRHFGALSGRAMIHLQLGRRDLALRDMRAALAVHPFLVERRFFPELEQEEITRV